MISNGLQTSTQHTGRLGKHTAAAIDRLKDGKPGDYVTLAEMNDAVGRDCSSHGPGRQNVDTAIRHVESMYNAVWRWDVTAKRWNCLDAAQRGELIRRDNKTTTRRVKRTVRIGAGTDRTQLDDDQRRDLDIDVTIAGMMAMAGSGNFRKRAALVIENGAARLREPEPSKLLELMKEAK
jgi:hypothetical protein